MGQGKQLVWTGTAGYSDLLKKIPAIKTQSIRQRSMISSRIRCCLRRVNIVPVNILTIALSKSSIYQKTSQTRLRVRLPETAWRTLQGYEAMNMIRKGQVMGAGRNNIEAQNQFISELFDLVA